MSFGPSKLTPSPRHECACQECCGVEGNDEFICLARNAFDVMMRRGWGVERFIAPDGSFQWSVESNGVRNIVGGTTIWSNSDPFTALVEADKWYRENIEK